MLVDSSHPSSTVLFQKPSRALRFPLSLCYLSQQQRCAGLTLNSHISCLKTKKLPLLYINNPTRSTLSILTSPLHFKDRLATLEAVRTAGISVCAGGIIGLGEGPQDRVGLLHTLATLPAHPESVPINRLVAIKGTPLQVWVWVCGGLCDDTGEGRGSTDSV